MSNNAQSMIYLSASSLLFITACIFALSLTGAMNRAFKESVATAQGQTRSIHAVIETAGSEIFTGSQVLYSIRDNHDAGLDIEVGGHVFAGSNQDEIKEWSMIELRGQYAVTYRRNGNGQIIRISFTLLPDGAGRP